MPSSYTASLRFEKQFTGENVNTWGDRLNTAFDRVDSAIAGFTTIALSGNYTLSSSNLAADEARSAMLKFAGTGAFTVTIPPVSKRYEVWNATTGVLSLTTGGGAAAALQPGEIVTVVCDGANVKRVQPTDFGGSRVTGVADPTGAQDAATKAYADALAFTANAGVLPGQVGNAGRFLITNGAAASWSNLPMTHTRSAAEAYAQLRTSADVGLPGVYGNSSGDAGFVNAAGTYRLKTSAAGRAWLVSDAQPLVLNEVATQAVAIAFAIAL